MSDYLPERFVWAIDKYSGHGAPRLRSAVEASPRRYSKIDEDHPVVDRHGRLLPPEWAPAKGKRVPVSEPRLPDPPTITTDPEATDPAADVITSTEPEEASA